MCVGRRRGAGNVWGFPGPAPQGGRVEPGCLGAWVPGRQRERARGEGERCVQDKSYLARPHPQHSDRPDSDPRSVSKPWTELLEAVFLARVIKIHIISHYLREKLRLLGVVLALSPRENRRKAPSLIVTSFSRCNCPFNLPAVRSVCTWFAICRHWAATLSSPFPPKRSFLVMGHLPGRYCFSADRGTFWDSTETERPLDPPQPIPGIFSLLPPNRDCASSRPPIQLPAFQQATHRPRPTWP